MGVTTTQTNKPFNPRGNDQSPLAFNRAKLYSGKALDFDGVNDSVSTPNLPMQSSNTWTIVMNINITQSASTKYIFDGREAGADGFGLYILDNTTRFNYYSNGTDNLTTYNFPSSEWFNLAIVRDGADVHFYSNGVFVETITHTTTYDVTGNFYIGQRFSGIQFLDGQMSGFKAFDVALTAAQVADLYNNPELVVPTGVDNTALKLWLPMMEGAGTTAYDGSGNGNHGTISGATYVNGIGAPVAQSAVIDWNKGVNLLDEYSEDFSNSGWLKTGSSISASSELNPYGKQTWEFEVTSLPSEVQVRANISGSTPSSTAFKSFVIAKAGTLNWLRVRNLFVTGGSTQGNVWFNLSTGSVGTEQSSQTGTMTHLGDGWYKCEVSGTTAAAIPNYLFDVGFTDTDNTNEPTATGGTGLLVLSSISLNGIYVETLGTAQTLEVLLPQGLTTGRDITGVNLFENVRKQGALNLDGNSWAEVHDNASVDVQSFTLECWVNLEFTGTYQEFLSKGDSSSDRTFELYLNNTENQFGVLINTGGFTFTSQTLNENQWYHVVASYDSTNDAIRGYVDSVEKLSTTGSVNPNNTDGDVVIGAWYDKTQLKTNGQIAQPRIYNRALTAEEVQRSYDSNKNTYTNS